jgi:hypothetical protein
MPEEMVKTIYYVMMEYIGTSVFSTSSVFYAECLNISEGRRSDAHSKPILTLAMWTYSYLPFSR